ncbi:MAG: TonB-dependent receptor domain-containing protein [Spirosomataceae bacterium]
MDYKRLIVFVLFTFSFMSLRGQMTLQKALAEVKKHHTFFYVYEPKWANIPVNASTQLSAPIHIQLEEIVANTPLTFQKIAKAVYLISPRNQSSIKKENTPVHVQNYVYQIRVLDKDSSFALPETWLVGENISVFTDSLGLATFSTSKPQLSLQFKRLGYRQDTLQLTYQQGDTTILLESSPTELAEVKIRMNGVDFLRSFTQMGVEEIQSKQMPLQPFGSDILHFLRLIPGVSPVVEPTNGAYVRGASPNQTLTVYDQIQLIQPEHFLTTTGFLPSEQIGAVSLDKSFIPARFGGRLGALLLLESKKQKEIANQVQLSVGIFQSRATWEQTWERKWSFVASVQKNIPSPFLTRLGNYLVNHRTLTLPNEIAQKIAFHDGTMTLNFNANPRFSMKWTYFQSADRFESEPTISTTYLYGNLIHWQNRGASWQLEKKWSPTQSFYLKTSMSVNEQTIQNQQRSIDSTFQGNNGLVWAVGIGNYTSRNQVVEVEAAHKLNKSRFELRSGFIGQFYNSAFINSTVVLTNGVENRETNLVSPILYTDAQIDFSPVFSLDAGVRFVQFPLSSGAVLEPRFQFQTKKKKWSSNVFYTRQSQALIKLALQTIPSHFNGIWVLADGKDIQVAQAQISGLNTELSFRKGAFLFHVFHKKQTNLTEFIPKFRPSTSPIFDTGRSKGWGVEMALKWNIQQFKSQFDYTWNQTYFAFPTISEGNWFRAPYIPQHEWKSWYSFTWKHWSISSTFVFAVQRPFILESFQADVPRNVNPLEYNTNTLTPYHRLDFGLSHHFSSSFSLHFSIQNVYNRKNEWYRVFENQEIRSIHQFGIIPSFFVKYNISTKK